MALLPQLWRLIDVYVRKGRVAVCMMREDCWCFKEDVWDFSVIYFGGGMLLLTAQVEVDMDFLWGVRLPGRE